MSSKRLVNHDNASTNSVKVALRIRPLNSLELALNANICMAVTPGETLIIEPDKSFNFDHVFDQQTPQNTIYDTCVRELVDGTFDGYNATVIAYGQTGSGKTYTMGMSCGINQPEDDQQMVGIIPRAAHDIFTHIERRQEEARNAGKVVPSFEVTVQFIELYNEEIIDLLAQDQSSAIKIRIHEDSNRHKFTLRGIEPHLVNSPEDILRALKTGAQYRKTAATNMNFQSSRSHAIFTVNIKQTRVVSVKAFADESLSTMEIEPEVYAKLHFVDLEGTERLKRTGATGETAKEGISINLGLLALGNVTTALDSTNGPIGHVPYRSSNLTRLLQDSLGGNSRTLMITCASPNKDDRAETLNTLNYANKVKNIRNKVVAGQNKSSQVITELLLCIQQLEGEYKKEAEEKKQLAEEVKILREEAERRKIQLDDERWRYEKEKRNRKALNEQLKKKIEEEKKRWDAEKEVEKKKVERRQNTTDHHRPAVRRNISTQTDSTANSSMLHLRALIIGLLLAVLLLGGAVLVISSSRAPTYEDNLATTAADERFMEFSTWQNSTNATVFVVDIRQEKLVEELFPFVAHFEYHETATSNTTNYNWPGIEMSRAEAEDAERCTTYKNDTIDAPEQLRVAEEPNVDTKGEDICVVNQTLPQSLGWFICFGFFLAIVRLIAKICMICCPPRDGTLVQQQQQQQNQIPEFHQMLPVQQIASPKKEEKGKKKKKKKEEKKHEEEYTIWIWNAQNGRSIKVDGLKRHYTVGALHERIANINEGLGIPPEQQQLIFNGKRLEDSKTLQYYDIVPHYDFPPPDLLLCKKDAKLV